MNQLRVRKVCWMAALACMVLGFGTRLSAQAVTGNAVMTVNLTDVLQLTINTSAVNLNFATTANYLNGVTSVVNSQLSIVSSRSYDLKIRAASANMVSGANTIPVSNVAVQTTGLTAGTPRVIAALSTNDQVLVTALPSTSQQSINMQYSTSAGNTAFLKPAGAYVTTLTFTVTAN